jgi:predicted kinase
MPGKKTFVLMSGYPGSGKSTLAARLAQELGFALLSKDAMLMTLYSAFEFGPGDAAASMRTGRAAWAVFWLQARSSPQAVLDTNIQWNSPQQLDELRSLGGRLVEVRCECPPEVARERYAARAALGHPAQRYTELDEARLIAYGRPVGLGPLVSVDSTGPVDAEDVARRIRAILG